jgi:hypothetical protein
MTTGTIAIQSLLVKLIAANHAFGFVHFSSFFFFFLFFFFPFSALCFKEYSSLILTHYKRAAYARNLTSIGQGYELRFRTRQPHTHTHTHTFSCVFLCVGLCVWVCVCVCLFVFFSGENYLGLLLFTYSLVE